MPERLAPYDSSYIVTFKRTVFDTDDTERMLIDVEVDERLCLRVPVTAELAAEWDVHEVGPVIAVAMQEVARRLT
jgi:hypothetical protein